MKLYPDIEPYDIQFLSVGDDHQIYIEQSGNLNGVPVTFLHGGPGAGTSSIYRRFFDPSIYRIIMFDQRGSGKSTPYGSVNKNTSSYLVEDIKTILDTLNIKKSILYGGSWGSTLALLFSERYPSYVHSLVLRGIFLCRSDDIKWFYQKGADSIYPDFWLDFINDIPSDERSDILGAFHKRIHGEDESLSKELCKRWAIWEGQCSTLYPSKTVVDQFDQCSISLAKIETHFFQNNCFIEENEIIKNINKIRNIRCEIVHGRYDIVCPFKQAYDLHSSYPNSRLNIINDAGHSLLEPGISEKILHIFNNHEKLIS